VRDFAKNIIQMRKNMKANAFVEVVTSFDIAFTNFYTDLSLAAARHPATVSFHHFCLSLIATGQLSLFCLFSGVLGIMSDFLALFLGLLRGGQSPRLSKFLLPLLPLCISISSIYAILALSAGLYLSKNPGSVCRKPL